MPEFDPKAVFDRAKGLYEADPKDKAKLEDAKLAFMEELFDWSDYYNENCGAAPPLESQGASAESVEVFNAIADLWILYAQFVISVRQFKTTIEIFDKAINDPIAGKSMKIFQAYADFCVDRNKLANAQKVYIKGLCAGLPDLDNNLLWGGFLKMMHAANKSTALTATELYTALKQQYPNETTALSAPPSNVDLVAALAANATASAANSTNGARINGISSGITITDGTLKESAVTQKTDTINSCIETKSMTDQNDSVGQVQIKKEPTAAPMEVVVDPSRESETITVGDDSSSGSTKHSEVNNGSNEGTKQGITDDVKVKTEAGAAVTTEAAHATSITATTTQVSTASTIDDAGTQSTIKREPSITQQQQQQEEQQQQQQQYAAPDALDDVSGLSPEQIIKIYAIKPPLLFSAPNKEPLASGLDALPPKDFAELEISLKAPLSALPAASIASLRARRRAKADRLNATMAPAATSAATATTTATANDNTAAAKDAATATTTAAASTDGDSDEKGSTSVVSAGIELPEESFSALSIADKMQDVIEALFLTQALKERHFDCWMGGLNQQHQTQERELLQQMEKQVQAKRAEATASRVPMNAAMNALQSTHDSDLTRFRNKCLVQRELLLAIINKALFSLMLEQQSILAHLGFPRFSFDFVEQLKSYIATRKSNVANIRNGSSSSMLEFDKDLTSQIESQAALVCAVLSVRLAGTTAERTRMQSQRSRLKREQQQQQQQQQDMMHGPGAELRRKRRRVMTPTGGGWAGGYDQQQMLAPSRVDGAGSDWYSSSSAPISGGYYRPHGQQQQLPYPQPQHYPQQQQYQPPAGGYPPQNAPHGYRTSGRGRGRGRGPRDMMGYQNRPGPGIGRGARVYRPDIR